MTDTFDDLLDVAPQTDSHTIGGKTVTFGGLSLGALVNIIAAFPEVRGMIAAKTVDFGLLIQRAPDAAAEIIAQSFGKGIDAKRSQIAKNLPAGTQLELLQKIYKLSFPNGLASLLEAAKEAGLFEEPSASPAPQTPQTSGGDSRGQQQS